MARFPFLSLVSLLALRLSSVHAQAPIEELSFGHKEPITPSTRGIPHFHLFGEPAPPQILRDKVILTPPVVGNRRGAFWTEARSSSQFWSASLTFRASGPERAGGNIQVWYTSNGHTTAGSSSLYTTAAFDGLAILISTSGGSAGQIRAFLNDGKTDFKSHHAVESLSFAHCDYSYRNLGVFSVLTLTQDESSFRVTIDGLPCIETDKVRLPAGYFFGVSASSAETPDSFEVSKFIVSPPVKTGSTTQGGIPPSNQQRDSQYGSVHGHAQAASQPPPAAGGQGSAEFAKLQEELKSFREQVGHLQAAIAQLSGVQSDRHKEMLQTARVPHEQLNTMDSRLQAVEQQVRRVREDIEGKDYRGHLDEIRHVVKEGHHQIMQGLPDDLSRIVTGSAPRMGMFVMWIVLVQIGLAAAYVIYKRRRANAPKKYL